MKLNKGFTLIELLVVIAVIGILSSIVLISLSGAQDAARDARAKASLSQLRSIAQMATVGDPGNYTGVCTEIQAAEAYDDLEDMAGDATCGSSASTFCIQITGLSDGSTWCADTERVASGTCTENVCN